MSKTKKTANWFSKHTKDPYVKKSQKDKYRSRAVYKLIEIDKKFRILNHCGSVLDLGSAPGSWLQYLQEFKNISNVIGVDILDIESIPGVKFFREDINNPNLYKLLSENDIRFIKQFKSTFNSS